MKETCLVGIDIGTTSSKGVLVTVDGRILAECSTEHGVNRPYPGWAEHDGDKVWWEEFVWVCRTLLDESGVEPGQVAGVGCSALYPNVLPVDEDGSPLRPAILYGIDTRAVDEIDLLNQTLGREYGLRVSGNQISSQSVAPKILWLRRHEPDVFARSAKFLTATSYIVFRLTGSYVIDHNSASLGGLPYNVDEQTWDRRTCDVCGISVGQLPELLWSNEISGYVTVDASRETGLLPGTPVTAGSGDFGAEMLSVGAYRDHQAVISYGTTFSLAVCSEKPVADERLLLSRTAIPGTFIIGGGMATGAALTKWFRDNFGQVESDIERMLDINAYQLLSEGARTVPAGSDGLIVLPYFAGERSPIFDPNARGVLIGLTLSHTRWHVYRALLEGVAYGIRHLQESMQDRGITVQDVIAVGGGTLSDVWTQIVSDVTQREQRVLSCAPGSSLGAAFLAGLAVDAIDSPSVIEDWLEIDRVVRPNPEHRSMYDECYRIYRRVYEACSEEMHALALLNG